MGMRAGALRDVLQSVRCDGRVRMFAKNRTGIVPALAVVAGAAVALSLANEGIRWRAEVVIMKAF